MKKTLILLIMLFAGMCVPVSAETTSYRIIQDGSAMIIVPTPSDNYEEQILIQKPLYRIKSAPAKIPYYSSEKTLPKAKNRTRSA